MILCGPNDRFTNLKRKEKKKTLELNNAVMRSISNISTTISRSAS